MATASTEQRAGVTEQDIRIFKSSLLARRFPEFQKLSDSDISTIIRNQHLSDSPTLKLESKTYPNTQFSSTARAKAPTGQTPIFYPINPAQAKLEAKRPDSECFIGTGTPYSADHGELMEDKISDEAKRCPVQPFKPSSTKEARKPVFLF